jgi:rhodanese-related sulfurtransferase
MAASLILASCAEPTMRDVPQTELRGGSDAVLIDVRTPEEFAAGHVPGAVNLPHTEIADRLDEIPSREVIVYCQSGKRAGLAGDVLLEAGFEVGHLEGDMLGWRQAGLPIETGEGKP